MPQIDIFKGMQVHKDAYDAYITVPLLMVRGGWHTGWDVKATLHAEYKTLAVHMQGDLPFIGKSGRSLVRYDLPLERASEIDFSVKESRITYRFSHEDPHFVFVSPDSERTNCIYQNHDTMPDSIQYLIRYISYTHCW